MRSLIGFILAALIAALSAGVIFARPDASCPESLPANERRNCFRQLYQQSDRELNQLYRRLRGSLPRVLAEDLRDNSRAWIGMKEGQCELAWMNNAAATEECLAGMTVNRVAYLRQAFERAPAAETLAGPGEYSDGLGGSLDLRRNGNRLVLQIQVVRGASFHTGEFEGRFRWIDRRAEIREGREGDADAPLCILRLQAASHGRIVVEEENCGYYHGLNAYFDGVYRPLTGR